MSLPTTLDRLLELLGGAKVGAPPIGEEVDALVALTALHRVQTPALDAWQQKAAVDGWPVPPESLIAAVKQSGVQSMAGAQWLERLAIGLSALRISFVALKGPTLATTLFGSPSKRAFRDIDILVVPDEIEAAVAVAQSLGWRLPADWKRMQAIVGKIDLELAGSRPLQPILEIHSHLFGSHIASPPLSQLVTIPVRLGRTEVPTLTQPEQLVYVALHGAKHFWFRLIWLTDLAGLFDRSDLVTNEVLRVARAWGAEAAVRAGGLLCHQLLGQQVNLPPADRSVARCAARIGRWALLRLQAGPEMPETFAWHVRERLVSDNLARALLLSVIDIARPVEIDVRALGVNKPSLLHRLARPIFWMRRRVRA